MAEELAEGAAGAERGDVQRAVRRAKRRIPLGDFGFNTITVSGIKLELAAVEALLPAGYVALVKSKRAWLDGAKVQFPQNGRSNESWAKALHAEMVKAHNAKKVEGVYTESSLQRELESPRK